MTKTLYEKGKLLYNVPVYIPMWYREKIRADIDRNEKNGVRPWN